MLEKIKAYFQKQVQEISTDVVLQRYGAFLSLTLTITGIFWIFSPMGSFLESGNEAICWPFWQSCQSAHILSLTSNRFLFGSISVLSLVLAWAFWTGRKLKHAYLGLILLTLIKLSVVALDYRFRMNQHIMSLWVTIVFLFIPNKRATLMVLIPVFYFWAGVIKFNDEWLSGAALHGRLMFLQGATLAWACAYVVLLELVLIWGLFFENFWVRFSTWAQLILFHLVSFAIVGFYYPVLMFFLIMIFPLHWASKTTIKYLPRSAITTVIVFSILQSWAHVLPGDTTLTGEGRLFSLHMIDAWTECVANATINRPGATPQIKNLRMKLPVRIQCDPVVYISRAHHLCESLASGETLDLSLRSRKTTDPELQTILDTKDFCHQDLRYSFWLHNGWISTASN